MRQVQAFWVFIAAYLLAVCGLFVFGTWTLVNRAMAEPAPPPADCRLLTSIDHGPDIWRCSGAGFERSCYVSVTRGGMAGGTSSITCGG